MSRPKTILSLCILVSVLTSCIQIHRTIEIRNDGSGHLIEVIRFDDQLFAMAKSSPEFSGLTKFLGKEKIQERMKYFGEVRLESHETRVVEGNIRETHTVFAFDNINKVTVPALPHRGSNWHQQKIRFAVHPPIVINLHYYPTSTRIHVLPLKVTFSPGIKDPEIKVNPKTPLEKEKLRSMLPVIRTMLKGLDISLKIRAFGSISTGHKTRTIYHVQDRDFADDDTLMKTLEWNTFPDEHFIWNEKLGRSGGHIMNKNRALWIYLESVPTQMDPINPLKTGKKK